MRIMIVPSKNAAGRLKRVKGSRFLFVSLTVMLTGCFSAKLLSPTQSDLDRVKDKYPDYTLADLNRGKTLYQNNCGKCHGLKDPASKSEEGWKKTVTRMSKRVNRKTTVLDEQAQQDILRYVITMGPAAKTK